MQGFSFQPLVVIQTLSMWACLDELITMVTQSRFSVTAGDLEIDLSGATVEVDARLIQMRHDDTWSIVLERLRDARDAAIDAAIDLHETSDCQSEVLPSVHWLRIVHSTRNPIKYLQQFTTFAMWKASLTAHRELSISCFLMLA